MDDRPLAVLGATGFTGRLVCEHARELGLPLRLVGRRREALEALARDGEEVRVADAEHEAELIAAFDGAFAVATTAGPFMATGPKVVGAAIAVGAHYLDTSAEQPFARLVFDGFAESAEEREVVLLTSFGFLYAPGDFAARLAAEGLEEPLEEIVVGYSVSASGVSAGTRRTVGRVVTQPLVAYEDGLVPSRFGKTTRRLRFPAGERSAIEWNGTEPLTVPRHTLVRRVRSYVRAPRVASWLAFGAPLAAPLIRLSGRVGLNPSEAGRGRAKVAVVAEARGREGGRRATLGGHDYYGMTGLLIARGAEALRAGEARATGALAQAEAFDARSFVERLRPLVEDVSVSEL